jgi:hypothetical protein
MRGGARGCGDERSRGAAARGATRALKNAASARFRFIMDRADQAEALDV